MAGRDLASGPIFRIDDIYPNYEEAVMRMVMMVMMMMMMMMMMIMGLGEGQHWLSAEAEVKGLGGLHKSIRIKSYQNYKFI